LRGRDFVLATDAGEVLGKYGRSMSTSANILSPGASSLVVETRELGKSFGERPVIKGVDLRVPRGVAFGYLGPNGAGKTTLIRTLLGLTKPTAGSVQLLGLPVPERRAEALAHVGAIVEEPLFHGHLTGRENLVIVAAARGHGGARGGGSGCQRGRERADSTDRNGSRRRLTPISTQTGASGVGCEDPAANHRLPTGRVAPTRGKYATGTERAQHRSLSTCDQTATGGRPSN
jgi:hypothetical protein